MLRADDPNCRAQKRRRKISVTQQQPDGEEHSFADIDETTRLSWLHRPKPVRRTEKRHARYLIVAASAFPEV